MLANPSIERELPANPACVCGDALNRALLVLGHLVQPRFVPGAVWSPVKGPVLMDRVFASLLHGPRAHRSTVWCVVYGLGRRFRSSALDSAFANVQPRPPAPSGSARDVPRSRSWPPSLFDAQDLLRSRSRLVPPRCRDPALRSVPARFLLIVHVLEPSRGSSCRIDEVDFVHGHGHRGARHGFVGARGAVWRAHGVVRGVPGPLGELHSCSQGLQQREDAGVRVATGHAEGRGHEDGAFVLGQLRHVSFFHVRRHVRLFRSAEPPMGANHAPQDVLGASRRFAALGAVPDHGAGQSTCASAPGRRCMEDDLRGLLGRGEDGSFQSQLQACSCDQPGHASTQGPLRHAPRVDRGGGKAGMGPLHHGMKGGSQTTTIDESGWVPDTQSKAGGDARDTKRLPYNRKSRVPRTRSASPAYKKASPRGPSKSAFFL
eukprot:scaffold843_cov330-Pavlova_lutheri.AAC.31